MNNFREQVRKALNQGASVETVKLSKVKPGKRNKHVLKVKKRLKKRGYFKGQKMTNYYGSGMKNAYSRFQKDLGFTGKDADGVPGKTSLQKLGFRVIP